MEREARSISALNHPNVCHLYDIGSHDGTDYLVMEFLEGETLAERIRKVPIPLNEVLTTGIAVAEALAAAHRQGIVHRDLKPGNIMLTRSGAKLMDFGLAKPAAAGVSGVASSAPLLSAARTMSGASPISPLTTAGALIGTIQYMSPEQIEGKEADARSDIFALGAVLYEMLTGTRPFGGKSQISVASAILEKDPERISAIQPLTPPALEYVISACLAKNPDERIQTAHDVALQLKWMVGSSTVASAAPAKSTGTGSSRRERMAWLVAAVLALLLVALGLWRLSSRTTPKTSYFAAPLSFEAQDLSIAPNGHTVVIVGHPESERTNSLWFYEPGAQEATRVASTEGASFPFWSADGRADRILCRWKTQAAGFGRWPGANALRCSDGARRLVEQERRHYFHTERIVGGGPLSYSCFRRNAHVGRCTRSQHKRGQPALALLSARWHPLSFFGN